MLRRLLLSAGLVGLVAAGAAAFVPSSEPFEVICGGRCEPGDDCLAKCEVKGEVPEGYTLKCCGNCGAGDNCVENCSKGACCEAR